MATMRRYQQQLDEAKRQQAVGAMSPDEYADSPRRFSYQDRHMFRVVSKPRPLLKSYQY